MAENQDAELDVLIQGASPVANQESPKKVEPPPKKKGLPPALLGGVLTFLAVIVAGFLYLDSYVQKKNAQLEEEYQKRKKEYRVQARRRMYDNIQGQLQAEMMDRMRSGSEMDAEPKKGERPEAVAEHPSNASEQQANKSGNPTSEKGHPVADKKHATDDKKPPVADKKHATDDKKPSAH
ncbi:MAG: hypothetical protein HQL77_17605 [Magnetococcales bacterium]|nr:hypothetical protein [Magnetococcales bacterium]